MLSPFAKVLLTSTAIAPVALTYACVAFLACKYELATGLIALCIILALLSNFLLWIAHTRIECVNFKAESVETADNENIAFLLLYLLPLLKADVETLTWQIWLPMIAIIWIITVRGYSYHFNPLLGIMGWHFYKVRTKEGVTYILITKKQIRNVVSIIKVGQLTEYVVLDKGES